MKILKTIGRVLIAVLLLIFVFVIVAIGPVERTHVQDQPVYPIMMARLDSIRDNPIPSPLHGFTVGYAKVNLTPGRPTALAGYGNRKGKSYTTVHDSIFVRSLVIDNGAQRVAIVSADLLIIPPRVTELLAATIAETGISMKNVYLGASHTHNSIGNWGEGATRFIYGGYEDSIVHFIAEKIRHSILIATSNLAKAKIRSGRIAVPDAVKNRLIDDGPEDPYLRVLEIERQDNKKLLLMTFAAHATCLYSRDLELSRDYPGELTDLIEESGYDFAMFMAGAVGSHSVSAPKAGWTCLDWMAQNVSKEFLSHRSELEELADSTLYMERVPLLLAEPQVKITEDFKVRPWLFRRAFGDYEAHLNVLRIGNVVMLGAPCDYSGELVAAIDSIGMSKDFNAIITSFNGGYIGYVTPTKYFDVDHYETRLMNWYPPGNAEYLQECFLRMFDAVAE